MTVILKSEYFGEVGNIVHVRDAFICKELNVRIFFPFFLIRTEIMNTKSLLEVLEYARMAAP